MPKVTNLLSFACFNANLANPIIVCNAEHRFLVAEQCQQINISNPTILLEPVGRNTAPAIAEAVNTA
jgi:mannose-1-phosphate guanylyltransferase